MPKQDKPWPEYPPVLKERALIQRGLQFYFTCVMCKELGWDKNCKGKDWCGQYLYGLMEGHFKRWENAKSFSAGTVRR